MKHEATYVYSYRLDTNDEIPETLDKIENLPFLYDGREQKNSRKYLECARCGARYPCF
ncbi:MAG: hypothetical protein GX193_03605 [Clostridiales bacterium]|nr:hypothetical protein [Clostridiales bacterium]